MDDSLVLSILLYNDETWTLPEELSRRLSLQEELFEAYCWSHKAHLYRHYRRRIMAPLTNNIVIDKRPNPKQRLRKKPHVKNGYHQENRDQKT